jgi:hypothetical protein
MSIAVEVIANMSSTRTKQQIVSCAKPSRNVSTEKNYMLSNLSL